MPRRKGIPADMAATQVVQPPTTAAIFGSPVAAMEANSRAGATLRLVSCMKPKPHPLQPASRHSEDNVRELATSIAATGLHEPPLVWRTAARQYVILAGHRRVHAWRLLHEEDTRPARMPVFLRTDLSEDEALLILGAEYCHRREFSAIHTAMVIGEVWDAVRRKLGREPSRRDLVAYVPWGKSSVQEYLKLYEALQDPRIAPIVQSMDSEPKSLIHKVLSIPEFSAKQHVLAEYERGGATAAIKAMPRKKSGRGGRPPATVLRRANAEAIPTPEGMLQPYEITVRVRANMTPEDLALAFQTLSEADADLRRLNTVAG